MSNAGQDVLEKLRLLLDNKNAVRDALYYKGVTDVTDVFSTYGDLIKNLSSANIGYSKPEMFISQQPVQANVDNDGQRQTDEQGNYVYHYMLRYVADYGDDDYNDGKSWDTPFKTIQKACNSMKYGVIYVMDGQYQLSDNLNMVSGKRIRIYGGFYRKNPTWEQRNPFAYMTVLNANGNPYGVVSKQSMFTDVNEINLLIDGLCVYNGAGEGYSAFKSSLNFCVRNCMAINCKQTSQYSDVGAGFHGTRKNIFQNCLAINCVSQTIAGGFRINTYDIVQNCYAIQCSANTYGGGFFVSSKSVSESIKGCFASGCYAKEAGGGFYIQGVQQKLQMSNCAVLSCRSSNGAAFYNMDTTNYLFYLNCVCFNCESQNSIIYSQNANLINCSVFGNKITTENGYPIWLNNVYGSKIINVLCCLNYYYAQSRTINVVDSTEMFMRHCAIDSDIIIDDSSKLIAFSSETTDYQNQWTHLTNISVNWFVSYLPFYWYLPVGYNIINDFKNNYFGEFSPSYQVFKNRGYVLQEVTPIYDFNNQERIVYTNIIQGYSFISIGAFN